MEQNMSQAPKTEIGGNKRITATHIHTLIHNSHLLKQAHTTMLSNHALTTQNTMGHQENIKTKEIGKSRKKVVTSHSN